MLSVLTEMKNKRLVRNSGDDGESDNVQIEQSISGIQISRSQTERLNPRPKLKPVKSSLKVDYRRPPVPKKPQMTTLNNLRASSSAEPNGYNSRMKRGQSILDFLDDNYDEIINPIYPKKNLQTDKKEKVQFVIDELIETEDEYIRNLEKAIFDYRSFIEENSPKGFRHEAKIIFGNLDDILDKSKQFLAKIKRKDLKKILTHFIFFESLFSLYPEYIRNKPKADASIDRIRDVIAVRQRALDDKLGLRAHLTAPIQRPCKYVLLLKEILKTFENDEDELYDTLKSVIGMIHNKIREADDLLALDSIKKLPKNLDESLLGNFIKSENFEMSQPFQTDVVVFLFDNIIMITSPENGQHLFLCEINNKELSLVRLERKPKTFLLKQMKKKPYISSSWDIIKLKARTNEIKDHWIQMLEGILWEQLVQERDTLNAKLLYSNKVAEYVRHQRPVDRLLNKE